VARPLSVVTCSDRLTSQRLWIAAPYTALKWLAVMCGVVAIAACSTPTRAPIQTKSVTSDSRGAAPARNRSAAKQVPRGAVPAFHRVVKGDTVFAIAWRYQLDRRDLIRWNKLRNPNLIVVGRALRLRAPSRKPATTRATVAPAAKKAPAPKPRPRHKPTKTSLPIKWHWPARGKTSAARSVSGSRGLEIRGKRGQKVNAAAGGKVVYSGSGLRGYGELIIIQHNETFLSAYAHNEARLVSEGQNVKPGQVIARMGNTDAHDVMLHFEIRRDGKTVDPYQHLPKR
jgi:lipoprotein NlpD